jgi:anaerobic ribonucleoside-triphosphate reductase activating protein
MVKLKYSSYDVVLQEIPNEISLAFTITGCQLACVGCHSEYLWGKNNGKELTDEKFEKIVKKYDGLISSVLFMGGEWESNELISKLQISKRLGLKTALYTGLNHKQMERSYQRIILELDYLKTGKWVEELGGLDSPTTNQRLINLNTSEKLNHYFIK